MNSAASDRWRVAWIIAGSVVVVIAGFVAVSFWIQDLDVGSLPQVLDGAAVAVQWAENGWRYDAIVFGSSVVVGAVILSRDRRHPYGWLLVAVGAVPAVIMAVVSGVFASLAGALPEDWAPWLAAALPVLFITTVAGFMSAMGLFPTGRAHTERWRSAFRLFWLGWLLVALLAMLTPGSSWAGLSDRAWSFDNPVGIEALEWFDPIVIDLTAAAFGVFVAFSVVARYRASDAETRHQLKWVMAAGGLVVLVSAVPVTAPWFGYVQTAAGLVVVGSLAIAITKYRLFEIDVVISRTLVFIVLVGFITLVYAGVAVGLGSLLGGSSLGWSIAATAFVAVVFEPVRDRVQRWINRLVYGRRATPYEVLSDLTGRLAATEREEGLLDRMAVRLAEGTGADRAVVWTRSSDVYEPVAAAPNGATPPVCAFDEIPGTVVGIDHDGELLGALSVETRRGDALTPTELRLVQDLAGSAALFLRRVRLDAELERKAQDLAESRRRLVDAQDVERRRLEREMNEGVQQQVLALKLQLGAAGNEARAEGTGRAAGMIDQMVAETQDAIEQIRALANGIYPPLLQAEGLAAAVTAVGESAPVDVRVEGHMAHRHPLTIEAAAYFCISEAMTNAIKHGEPPITVALSDESGEVVFTVTDSGPGFDPHDIERGSGLTNMEDRVNALDGTIAITSEPGGTTSVEGHLPHTRPDVKGHLATLGIGRVREGA